MTDLDEIRGHIYAADREQLQDAVLAVLDVAEGWHRKAAATFADTTLSGSAQKAEQVMNAIALALR
jgi:hypothetical protein